MVGAKKAFDKYSAVARQIDLQRRSLEGYLEALDLMHSYQVGNKEARQQCTDGINRIITDLKTYLDSG